MIKVIKSRALGEVCEFVRPRGGNYIWVSVDGSARRQVCDGGGFRGNTLSYHGEDDKKFYQICAKWIRQRARLNAHTIANY